MSPPRETSDLLINSLVAGLVNTFVSTDASNVDEGNHAINLTFDDWNQNIRLVGEMGPLSENNRPMDQFEMSALTDALGGQAADSVERVRGSMVLPQFGPASEQHRSVRALPHKLWSAEPH